MTGRNFPPEAEALCSAIDHDDFAEAQQAAKDTLTAAGEQHFPGTLYATQRAAEALAAACAELIRENKDSSGG